MRVFYAYFLLVITSIQWIGGASWYRIIHTKALVYAMDHQEASIAEQIEEETGLEVSVELLAKDQLTPRGLIYSDFFAFTHTDQEDTVYFTFRHDQTRYDTRVEKHPLSPSDQENEVVLVQGLFQHHLIPLEPCLSAQREEPQETNHFYTAMQSNDHQKITPPPPQQA